MTNLLVSFAAQWLIIVPAVLVLGVIVARRRWKADIFEAAASGALAIVLVKIAAAVVHEKRPFVLEHVHPLVAHAADNSFPSDHLTACGIAFAYLWPRSRPMALAALVFAAAIACARVLAHLHWPIDVASGFALGALATIAVRLLSALPRRATSRKRIDTQYEAQIDVPQ